MFRAGLTVVQPHLTDPALSNEAEWGAASSDERLGEGQRPSPAAPEKAGRGAPVPYCCLTNHRKA